MIQTQMTSQLIGLLLLFPVLLSGGLLIKISSDTILRGRRLPGVAILAGFLVGVIINSASYALELISPTLQAKYFWHGGYYLGIAVLLPFLLWFALRYNQNRERLSRWQVAVLFVPGFLIFLVYSTNHLHHLFYSSVWLDTTNTIPSLQKTNGSAYWFSVSWIYFCFLAANWIVFGYLKHYPAAYRKHIVLLAFSMLAPMLIGLLYLFHIRPFGFLNLAAIANSITGFFCASIIYRYRLLDLTPVAYQRVFEKIPLGVIVVDPLGWMININPVALSDFGVAEEAVLGKPIDQLGPDRKETLLRLIALDQPEVQEFHWQRGETERIFLAERTLLKAENAVIGQLILLRDTTERKRQEQIQIETERLSASMHERERLANEIHDGIAQVMGYTCAQVEAVQAYLMNNEISLAQATLTLLGEAARDAHADIRSFILGIKADSPPADLVAKPEATPLDVVARHKATPDVLHPLPSQEASFCAALSAYCTQFTHLYELPIKLSIPHHCPDDLFEPASETNVLRIIQEALTNARKHSQASCVEITLLININDAVFFIEDNGCGYISSETPTRPLHPGAQTQAAGEIHAQDGLKTHFGMQIMRARAAEINGRLELRSNPGMGTQVILHAPRRKLPVNRVEGGVASPLASTSAGRLTPMNVLLVDDQPLFRTGLRNLLQARGLNVVGEANNGAEAVQLAEELRPKLILMDYHMPVMDGLEATRQIKALLPETHIVMLTVNEDRDLLFKAMNHGASGYLLKDLKPDEFFGMLETLARGDTPISARLTGQLLSSSAQTIAMQTEFFINDRQLKFLQLAGRGMTHREIADMLHMSESTVKYHFKQIFDLLGVRTRDEALVIAAKRGWIERRGSRS